MAHRRSMRLLASLLAILLALLTSGCFGPAAVTESAPRGVGTSGPIYFETGLANESLERGDYWLVLIKGSERVEPRGEGANATVHKGSCDELWEYRLDRDKRVLTVSQEPTVDGYTILVLVDFKGAQFDSKSIHTGCPTASGLYAFRGKGDLGRIVGHYGVLKVQAFRDGTLGLMEQYVLPMGIGARVEYTRTDAVGNHTYWVHGSWSVENLGAWASSDIVISG
jgi:hypothetical protein